MIDRQAGPLTQRAPSGGTDKNRPPLMTINADRDAPLTRAAKDSGRETEGALCPTARAQLALKTSRPRALNVEQHGAS